MDDDFSVSSEIIWLHHSAKNDEQLEDVTSLDEVRGYSFDSSNGVRSEDTSTSTSLGSSITAHNVDSEVELRTLNYQPKTESVDAGKIDIDDETGDAHYKGSEEEETCSQKKFLDEDSKVEPSKFSFKKPDDLFNVVPAIKKVSFPSQGFNVKVTLHTDDQQRLTTSFRGNNKIADVKSRICKVFHISPKDIKLTYYGVPCTDNDVLSELGSESYRNLDLGIHSTKPTVLVPGDLNKYQPTVRSFTVLMHSDIDRLKRINVTLVNQCFVKDWLGGYRNKKTNTEYHHATTQTLPRRRAACSLERVSRDAQTPIGLSDSDTQTMLNKYTQSWRPDYCVSTTNDKIVAADSKRFKNIERIKCVMVFKLILQLHCVMRTISLKREQKRKLDYVMECWLREKAGNEAREEIIKKRNATMTLNTTFPTNRNDFYLMYLTVGKWWKKVTARARKTTTGSSKIAVAYNILAKEVDLLSVIERQRIKSKEETLLKQEMNFLSSCARQIIFRNREGIMSSVDLLESQQAREMQEIVSSFFVVDVKVEERLDTLQTLIMYLQSNTYYSYAKDIIDLLRREGDLLRIGATNKQLKVLRDRVRQLLFHNLHLPLVNERVKSYRKPNCPKTDKRHYYCKFCGKLKMASEFNVHVVLTEFKMCFSCEWMKNISQERSDFTPYVRILNDVRRSEMQKCCRSSYCFVLQPVGMFFLVHKLWNSRSILSDRSDLNELKIVRFLPNEDWSPWNSILLTLDEAEAHSRLDDVENFYGGTLLAKIRWRHMRAKLHFLPLVLNERFMQESKIWTSVQDAGIFIYPTHINEFAKMDDFEDIA